MNTIWWSTTDSTKESGHAIRNQITGSATRMDTVTCYLDSTDYSVLTDPRRDTPEIRRIKDALKHLANSGQVTFVFSLAIVSESAPLATASSHLAELRAELLYELCGSNALISSDRLAKLEINALARRSGPPKDILDPHGRWFPAALDGQPPAPHWEGMQQITEEMLQEQGLPRHERRARLRALFKNGKPRPALKDLWTQRGVDAYVAELLAAYPMRPEDADALVRYTFGEVSEEVFSKALLSSLSDVRWMMKWFATDHSLASPISEIVRKPGREIGQVMRQLAELGLQGAAIARDSGDEDNPTGKQGRVTLLWQENTKMQLMSMITQMAKSANIQIGNVDIATLDHYCSGLSTAMRSVFSSVWSNVGEGRKERPSDSQPVDAMHALYAPYVDVFRADRFMAPHIQKQVKTYGTVVVPVLPRLLSTLDERLV